jgi:hypothetical protein
MTADAEIPDDVQAFLRDQIESYEELEVLLLLHGSHGQWLDVDAIKAQLPLPGISMETVEILVARQLLVVRATLADPVYAYGPANHAVEATVARLAQSYAVAPLALMKLMTNNAMNRLRVSALETFADAFVLRRKKKRDV